MSKARPQVRALWLPKKGHAREEYEDAYAVPEGEAFPLRAAVADGATESAFAGVWARQLVEGFAAHGASDAGAFIEALPRQQERWRRHVEARAAGLPWYAAAKAAQGAFAAFLGLVLTDAGTWQALAVGDCCLFHLRDGGLLRAWPFDAPEQFTQRPALLPSLPGTLVPPVETTAGAWRPGDALLLATDALAAYLLATDPTATLSLSQESFRRRVVEARAAGTLRNDDVTLVLVRCP